MASHPEIELVPFLRGELNAQEHDRVQHHLDDCEHCRESMDELASTMHRVAAHLEELPTPEWSAYRRELRLKIAQRAESRSRWWRPSFAWASLAGAGIAVAALILAMVMRPSMLGAPEVDQLALEQPETVDVGLLRNYAVVERLDLLENYDVIEHLDELPSSSEHNHDSRS